MQLIYINSAQTAIKVTLEQDETLGNLNGPMVAYVPTDSMNTDYADVLSRQLAITTYAPPANQPPANQPAPSPTGRVTGGGMVPTAPLNKSGSA